MPDPSRGIRRYEFRNLRGRGRHQALGSEEWKERFWLVVSDAATHQYRLLIGTMTTTAEGRTYRGYLFPPADESLDVPGIHPRSRIDVQQLWTFSFDRDNTDRHPAPFLDSEEFVARLNARIRRQLATQPRPALDRDERYDVGRVVWIRLRGKAEDPDSDLHAVQLLLSRTYGSTWQSPSMLLPAVIVATAVHERRVDPSVLPLITVVPILVLPGYRERHRQSAPTVASPSPDGDPVYSVLTQLLLTVDFQREGRVHVVDGSLMSWSVTDTELEAIRSDVCRFMGIRYDRS